MVIYYYYSWRWNNTYYPPCAMTNQPLRPKTPGVERSKGEGGERSRYAYTWKIRSTFVVRFRKENFIRFGIAEWGPASQKLKLVLGPRMFPPRPAPPFPTRKRRHGSWITQRPRSGNTDTLGFFLGSTFFSNVWCHWFLFCFYLLFILFFCRF